MIQQGFDYREQWLVQVPTGGIVVLDLFLHVSHVAYAPLRYEVHCQAYLHDLPFLLFTNKM